MTFRARVKLVVAILGVVPVVAMAVAMYLLARDSERRKVDAALATSMRVGQSLHADGRRAARARLRRIAADGALRGALARGDVDAARSRLREVAAADPRIVFASATLGGRRALVGSPRGAARASGVVRGNDGRELAMLALSVTDARTLVRAIARRTGEDALLIAGGGRPATSEAGVRTVPAGSETFESGGVEYRGLRLPAGAGGEQLAVFTEEPGVSTGAVQIRLLLGGAVAVVVLLALAGSIYLMRDLGHRLDVLLGAARRLALGDFRQRVPAEGDDELAQLGREFKRMSLLLEQRMQEVDRHRAQLEETIRRVGKGIATGPDPHGILELTVQTAVDACRADFGRALSLDATDTAQVRAGDPDTKLIAAIEAAERDAFSVTPATAAELLEALEESMSTPDQREPVGVARGEVKALAMPIRARLGSHGAIAYAGVISIARRGPAFAERERELLSYLGVQAVVSIENADLHMTVQRQALTDELTGLANVRDMYAALDRELERGHRFDTPTGFVLIDIDDFKRINDSYGHQQGDEVLSQVAGVLRRLSRELDEPARYGGEELAVVLPQTDADGATMLAERMRAAIEGLRIGLIDGDGEIGVTASFGVASAPAHASGRAELVAAADCALYEAKRVGKNRVVCAGPPPVGSERSSEA